MKKSIFIFCFFCFFEFFLINQIANINILKKGFFFLEDKIILFFFWEKKDKSLYYIKKNTHICIDISF